MGMASPTFQAVSGMNSRRIIEPGSAVSDPDPEEGTHDMPRRTSNGPMESGPERDALMVRLYQEGKSNKEIREATGLTYDSAIYLALQRAGIKPTRGAGRPSTNGTALEIEPDEPEAEPETSERSVPVSVVVDRVTPEPELELIPETETMTTYVLRVAIMRPVVENVEVDVSSFDEAVRAAHTLEGLVQILGVVEKNTLKAVEDGDGQ